MISHEYPQFGLEEDTLGEMVIPSENGNIHTVATVRQFIIQARRNYSQNALNFLEESEEVIVKNLTFSLNDPTPYFHMQLKIQPADISVKEWLESDEANTFFEHLLKLFGTSSTRGISGNRTAFVSAFELDPQDDEVLISNILVGVAVFFNDYRATFGYPNPTNSHEIETVIQGFIQNILYCFPNISIEVDYNII